MTAFSEVWSQKETEAVLRVRVVTANGTFDRYCDKAAVHRSHLATEITYNRDVRPGPTASLTISVEVPMISWKLFQMKKARRGWICTEVSNRKRGVIP